MVGDSMNELHAKKKIEQALKDFQHPTMVMNARHLLNTLGYESEITMDFDSNLAEAFVSYFDPLGKLNTARALVEEWESIDFLCQLTEEEIAGRGEARLTFNNRQLDNTIIESYVFFALKLRESQYTRTQLATITREINKLTPMPAMLIFQHGQTLTLAIIDRRLHTRDKSKDVLEKVTLIKDIDIHAPHPAHIKILFELSCDELFRVHGFSNFVELHRAWAKTLDIQALNKQFYRELSNWYFWAVEHVTFPEDAGENIEIRNATSVIRLITRLIFVWFIKEKKLIPDALFNPRELERILSSLAPQESTYYKAILQNLFFATLNQEMNTPQNPNSRKFRGEGRQHYNITSLYRYKRYFTAPDEALRHSETIPFLNGGLFECLDKRDADDATKILRVDGFSDREDNPLSVPNFLFFSEERDVDLNKVYDTKGKRYKVRGLLDILRRYKFTMTENTPIEEEVALDPELLGKVFENLLAAYTPETGATARKQTGSFYTPREIVNYMVDEALIAHLKSRLIGYYASQTNFSGTSPPSQLDFSGRAKPVQTELDTQETTLSDAQKSDIEQRLRHLTAYNDESHLFNESETEALIKAIDTLKILDPACGSGAFPMGILHKLVFILGKLDPGNEQWRQRQIAKVETLITMAEEIDDSTVRRNTVQDLEREIDNINEAFARNELDYGRKLYLIENCIYGVDIQPIAVQIAKLRFFISLVAAQRSDDSRENRGVRPLPNLETKFVAGNTLIGVGKPAQQSMRNPEINRKEKELGEVRRKHFTARTPRTKEKYRALDKNIRADISELLQRDGFPSETTEKIANWDPYDQNATADFFDPEWMFGIMGGFDVVIGNPPYAKTERLSTTQRNQLSKHYSWAGDLYDYFIFAGFDLASEKGIFSYIANDSYVALPTKHRIRDLFLKNQLLHLVKAPANTFEASIYTAIFILLKSGVDESHAYMSGEMNSPDFQYHSNGAVEYATIHKIPDRKFLLSGKNDWVLRLFALENVEKFCDVLDTGIDSGNVRIKIFFKENNGRRHRLLQGKQIQRYSLEWDSPKARYLFCDVDYEPLPIPGIGRGGKPSKRNEYWKFRGNIENHHQPERLLMRQTDDDLIVAYHSEAKSGRFYTDNTLHTILPKSQKTNLKYFLALFNSRLLNFVYHAISQEQGKSQAQVKIGVVKKLPVVVPAEEEQRPIIALVDDILAAKAADADADTAEKQKEIDKQVYALYNLTQEEIALVEAAAE